MPVTLRPSASTTLLLLVVLSLTAGLATMPLVKVALEAAMPGSETLWNLARAEWHAGDPASDHFTWDFGRLSRRWLLLVTLATFIAFRRHVAWAERAREGLCHDSRWRRHVALGAAAGVAATIVYFTIVFLAGQLRWVPRDPLELAIWILEVAVGAAFVGFVEEVFFRAVMLRTMIRDWGTTVAVAASTAVFALVHAISGSLRVSSGWDPLVSVRLLRTYYTNPEGSVADDLRLMVGLALLGALLCLVVIRTGSLWTAIGLHAAMVLASRVGKKILYPEASYREWLLGDRSILVAGVIPWIVLTVAIVLVASWPRPRTGPQPPPEATRT